MAHYRVYRVGRDGPVRVVGRDHAQPPRSLAPAVQRSSARFTKPALVATLFGAAVVLALLSGRHAFSDSLAVLSLVGHLRHLPHWLPYAIGLVVALALALGACSLSFGRRTVFKVVCLAALVALFAAPGVALGWASDHVSQMGGGGSAAQKATVAKARTVLARPLPGAPMNILLLGGDSSRNSDSEMLVRLDPRAGTISMLSVPRDLYTDIPGVGYAKLNAAYADGGVKLAVETFTQVTGLPINHFICLDFNEFWKIIDLLHGVYLPVDHRYYNPEGTGFQPINIQPGYQLLRAKQALNFVRFRHDQDGDFTRQVRQQLFLRAVQQQAMRWSGSWTKVVSMVRAITGLTTTDLDSLSQLLPVVDMALALNTSHIYQVHIEGTTPTIGGVDYVVASPAEIATAVQAFEHPVARHAHHGAAKSTASSSASPAASPSRSASASPSPAASASPVKRSGYDWSAWQALARHTSLTLEAPQIWPSGLGYDTAGVPFRAYSVRTPDGHSVKAAIAVGTVTGGAWGATEYWGVQALAWANPPAIANPNSTRTIGGRTYLLFNEDKSLHMVAWHENGDTYWVVNTLDNLLSKKLMMALAESCQVVR